MSTPKHTPGPWAVEPRQWDHGASLAIVAPHSGYIVAIVPFDEDIQIVDEPDSNTVRRHPDDLPNARMLAAAPAMYEALSHAAISTHHPSCKCTGEYSANPERYCTCHVQKARTALAQAEGCKI